jgi:hypothetical protein
VQSSTTGSVVPAERAGWPSTRGQGGESGEARLGGHERRRPPGALGALGSLGEPDKGYFADLRRCNQASSSPTNPLRNAITQTTKITPMITLIHEPT